MFDIGWGELLLVGAVALVVIGPKELPRALRTLGQMTSKMKRMAAEFQSQFSEAMREAELDEIRRDVTDVSRSARDMHTDIAGFNPIQTIRNEIKGAVEGRPPIPAIAPEAQDPNAGALPVAEPVAGSPLPGDPVSPDTVKGTLPPPPEQSDAYAAGTGITAPVDPSIAMPQLPPVPPLSFDEPSAVPRPLSAATLPAVASAPAAQPPAAPGPGQQPAEAKTAATRKPASRTSAARPPRTTVTVSALNPDGTASTTTKAAPATKAATASKSASAAKKAPAAKAATGGEVTPADAAPRPRARKTKVVVDPAPSGPSSTVAISADDGAGRTPAAVAAPRDPNAGEA